MVGTETAECLLPSVLKILDNERAPVSMEGRGGKGRKERGKKVEPANGAESWVCFALPCSGDEMYRHPLGSAGAACGAARSWGRREEQGQHPR